VYAYLVNLCLFCLSSPIELELHKPIIKRPCIQNHWRIALGRRAYIPPTHFLHTNPHRKGGKVLRAPCEDDLDIRLYGGVASHGGVACYMDELPHTPIDTMGCIPLVGPFKS